MTFNAGIEAAALNMTTRDDLVSRLREKVFFSDEIMAARMPHDEGIIDRYRAERKEAASAIEAKDAEIARLKAGWNDCISDLTAAQKRISSLERQLAEETERCARLKNDLGLMITYGNWQIAEGPGHHPTFPSALAQANATLKDICESAAAIRGGAK